MGVNTASHLDYENGSIIDFFKSLNMNMEELTHFLRAKQVDVDIYRSESGVTGQIILGDQVRNPFIVTDILAQWFAPSSAQSQETSGISGVAPVAGTTIVTGSLDAAGTYTVAWTVGLSGTAVTQADTNNFGLYNGGTLLATSMNPPVIGVYPQTAVLTEVLQLNQLTVKPIANASAAAVYSASITQTLNTPESVTLIVGDRTFILDPLSGQFIFNATKGMQVDNHSKISLTVSPALPCHLEIMGYEDYRKIDRQ
jgi:hypothetical protein